MQQNWNSCAHPPRLWLRKKQGKPVLHIKSSEIAYEHGRDSPWHNNNNKKDGDLWSYYNVWHQLSCEVAGMSVSESFCDVRINMTAGFFATSVIIQQKKEKKNDGIYTEKVQNCSA